MTRTLCMANQVRLLTVLTEILCYTESHLLVSEEVVFSSGSNDLRAAVSIEFEENIV